MDFTLRCNALNCRVQLVERAVVTTCSHVFCNPCSDELGLTAPAGASRVCPACRTLLSQPDDAVSTSLHPTEDYKTSVLSGLSPSTIMECAGRGLAFWSYQSTQEIVYQEYTVKAMTEKHNTLNVQIDKILNDANSELNILNQKLNNMQIDQDRLKLENKNLVTAFREKSRKHQQTQELYDRLKRKEMTAATQSAAFDSVDEVLGNVPGRQGFVSAQHTSVAPRSHAQQDFQSPQRNRNGIEQLHARRKSGSNEIQGNGAMMPPPLHRPGGTGSNTFGFANPMPTPSNHRTQLGPTTQSASRLGTLGYRHDANMFNKDLQNHTAGQRQSLASLNMNSVNRNGLSGYGMSAGMKVGRQQGSRPSEMTHSSHVQAGAPLGHEFQAQQFQRDEGVYY
ncbi:hypothetical protein HO173_005698 [Letharia columbiana]|uniref:RING-type domain-containing protein n=1 Tax=Letharia columbiana TaxID=112416 RepID=A0A8H6FWE4_9LECA|nr:uncharacterized protein HO173_005698 [Letharia columbiana]KAF6236070.1 hypothetical protein HO173_005698 [Letharia columbiana]